MKITKRYETKLESAPLHEICATLDAKLEATSPESVADYVAFGIENLEAKIARMKEAKKELDYLIKETEGQVSVIKNGSAKWLSEAGIDKLDGDIVSSIKLTQPKPKEELIVTSEEALINAGYFKTVVDKTMAKNAILNGTEVEGAHIEVTHLENSITVYNKRKK